MPQANSAEPNHIVGRSRLADLEHKEDTTDRRIGLDGYGKRKHPSRWMVRLPGGVRWRRVYVCCMSNAGTAYVEIGRGWHVID